MISPFVEGGLSVTLSAPRSAIVGGVLKSALSSMKPCVGFTPTKTLSFYGRFINRTMAQITPVAFTEPL